MTHPQISVTLLIKLILFRDLCENWRLKNALRCAHELASAVYRSLSLMFAKAFGAESQQLPLLQRVLACVTVKV